MDESMVHDHDRDQGGNHEKSLYHAYDERREVSFLIYELIMVPIIFVIEGVITFRPYLILR